MPSLFFLVLGCVALLGVVIGAKALGEDGNRTWAFVLMLAGLVLTMPGFMEYGRAREQQTTPHRLGSYLIEQARADEQHSEDAEARVLEMYERLGFDPEGE